MTPLPGRVIIKRDEFDHKIGNVHLPQGAYRSKEGSRFGTVLAVNEENPHKFTPGDRVLFEKFAGNTVNIDDQDVYVCHEKLVLAVISD